jgi:predicted metalloprotease with PDZ domain
VWGKAGLHTGDRIVSVNGSAVNKWPAFRNVLRNLAIGDSISISVQRGDQKLSKVIVVTGYDQPDVTLRQIARPSEKQERIFRAWLAGN